ncbi:MAG TPA: metalloregulator ArsR/SmtB family transcription factor [Anaerolineales bacterium]|nr:metalloregulator ArsR/SmtB family transcription factor [Anaerolineales bacterium]
MLFYDDQARLFKALSHPARLAILDILRDGEHCVCHIETALGYRQAYISQNLTLLRDTGLVADRREGWNIFYRVTKPEVFDLMDAAQALVGPRPSRRARSGKISNCPCPHCNPKAEPAGCG